MAEKKRRLQIRRDLDEMNAKYSVDNSAQLRISSDGISADGGLMAHLSTSLSTSFQDSLRGSAGQKPLVQRRVLMEATFREMDDLSKVLKELAAQRSQFEQDASGPATTRHRPASSEQTTVLGSGSGALTDRPSHRDRPAWPNQPAAELEASTVWAQAARTRLDGVHLRLLSLRPCSV